MLKLLSLLTFLFLAVPITSHAQYEKLVQSDSARIYTSEEKELISQLSNTWQGPIPGRKNLYEVISFDENKNFVANIYKEGNEDKLISSRPGRYYLLYNNFIILHYKTEDYYRTAKVRRLTEDNLQLNIQMDCSGEIRLKLKKVEDQTLN